MSEANESPVLLPHHEQQPLCTTRLPYRQGRKLTAVKTYTVVNESNHLLIFGVPTLNLRQELKALYYKFGKLIHFNVTKEHIAEEFTETYHAAFCDIQSARQAKRFTDTKNFYGGCLHVCYAPEYESVQETRNKLLQRQRNVLFRLKNLQKQSNHEVEVTADIAKHNVVDSSKTDKDSSVKLNMGEVNTISIHNEVNRKRKDQSNCVVQKKFKPCFVDNINVHEKNNMKTNDIALKNKCDRTLESCRTNISTSPEEIIDFTSTETETITNINDSLNYRNFGNEDIRKVQQKPINRIKFNFMK
ncbi:unnamed protein product [Chilo suppressalis]|uniref:RNA-binding protein 48 n=1 Tax=Chilo suppressalis TaxID=168631 RepID=A0ABN8L5Q6_CHISP|nr:unnamed protein product [Chilo suppressalis]